VSLGMIVFPACLLAGFVFVKAPRLIHEDAECETMGAMLRHPFFLATLAVIALGGAMEIGMVQWLPAYAERGLGYPKDIAGASLAAFSVSMVVGRVLVGFLIRHVGAIPIMLVCCAASAALILTGSFATSPPVALTACVVLGFTGACFWPTTLGLAGDRFPRGGASMYGMLSAMGNTGCIVMPWVVGVVAGQTRLNLGLALVAVCPLFMALILTGMSLARKMRRDA
ncbi:MAG: MFS transporter, partial [Nitrospiraceae bacterium]|nr:MFS transporter [Nitrospiraceae bacterium]